MANKSDRFYFENFIACADCACRAARYLESCLENYDPEKLGEMIAELHKTEHEADIKKHEMSAALAKAFVTPLEREDLDTLSQNIDEVTDKIEEVLQLFYIYGVEKVKPNAIVFVQKIIVCCEKMREMLVEFEHYKKSTKLKDMIIELNHTEEECDQLYLESSRQIHVESVDPLEIISWRDIYSYMEACSDACEHVADSIETVVLKNS